jgi:hypothetical protein
MSRKRSSRSDFYQDISAEADFARRVACIKGRKSLAVENNLERFVA